MFFRYIKIIKGDCAFNYIEFAVDFLVPNKKSRDQLQPIFNRHLVRTRKSLELTKDFHYKLFGNPEEECKCNNICTCQTRYFNPSTDKICMAMYIDKLSKTDNVSACIHIEIRIKEMSSLKKIGLYTFDNIIQHDHEAFWKQHLDLRSPNFTELGILNLFSKKTQNRANIKRGKKQWVSINNLQEYLRNNKHCSPAFKEMSESKLKEYLQEYLSLI